MQGFHERAHHTQTNLIWLFIFVAKEMISMICLFGFRGYFVYGVGLGKFRSPNAVLFCVTNAEYKCTMLLSFVTRICMYEVKRDRSLSLSRGQALVDFFSYYPFVCERGCILEEYAISTFLETN